MKIEEKYDFKKVEAKWQRIWEEEKTFFTGEDKSRPNYYCLVMYPYPSGHIHVGHVRNYIIGDVLARYKRMRGYNVLHPIGWDAFGLPAENAAIQNKIQPEKWTKENIAYMRDQLKRLGISYDWSREIATCDPEYYKWNQWFFLKFYEKGLCYRTKSAVNWCPSCQTVLANEQVLADGGCWRCHSVVEQKELEQWFFRIRAYAEKLLEGLKELESSWPSAVLLMQKNWIGKSEGAEVQFPIPNSQLPITVFTTRPDTLFGATFMVLAPEHKLIADCKLQIKNYREIEEYIKKCQQKSKEEAITEKTGVKLEGIFAFNPVNNEKIPVWTADYVTMEYGSGAIMAVPAHDKRDFEFAKKYGLPIREVIHPTDNQTIQLSNHSTIQPFNQPYEGEGIMVNSGEFSGVSSTEGKEKIIAYLEKEGLGKRIVEYRLKDWLISRQRYWGTPIPIIYCEHCGVLPVREEDLPVILPENVSFTGTGESPLAKVKEFVFTKCWKCQGKARRETDTMDTFVDSSWYYARYLDPKNEKLPFAKEKVKPWLPVHQYIGGIEHACMHLIYSRFFHCVMRDLGLVNCAEPFAKLLTQGMVTLGGVAMSKSRGNVVEPEKINEKYGTDTLRLFVLFASPPEKDMEWSDQGIEGSWRFLNRVWRLVQMFTSFRHGGSASGMTRVHEFTSTPIHQFTSSPVHQPKSNQATSQKTQELIYRTHLTIKRVTEDIEKRLQFNTAIAAIMELVNCLYVYPFLGDEASQKAVRNLILLLYPFVPHLSSELGEAFGETFQKNEPLPWPEYDPEVLISQEIEIGVQVNGKLRMSLKVAVAANVQELKEKVLAQEKIKVYLAGKKVKEVICVPQRIVNIVTD